MTQLTDYLNQGYRVLVSPYVEQDTVFAFTNEEYYWGGSEHNTLAFHPLNYNYLAYDDPFVAHELNLAWIQENVIDRLADQALKRLDDMVDEMNRKYEPRIVTHFLPHTHVQENEDGSFTFFAAPMYTRGEGGVVDLEGLFNDLPEGMGDDHIRLNEEYYQNSTPINKYSKE